MSSNINSKERVNKILIAIGAIIFAALVVFAAAFYVAENYFYGGKDDNSFMYTEITDWTATYKGNTYEVDLPEVFDVSDDELGQNVILEATLPDDLSTYNVLDFYNSTDGEVYINGERRYRFVSDNPLFTPRTLKQFHSYITLNPEDAGGIIRIVNTGDISATFRVAKIYAGTSLGLFDRILDANLSFFIFSAGLVIIATLAVIIGIILRLFRKSNAPIIAAGLATAYVSLWLIFNSELYQFIFHNGEICGIMSNLMLILIPFPIVTYINGLQKGRYTRGHIIICLVYEVAICLLIYSHFIDGVTFRIEVIYILIAEIVVFAICMAGLIRDIVNGHYKEYILSFIGTMIFVAFAIAEFVLYLIVEVRHAGTSIMMGTYIWITFAILEQLVALRRARDAANKALSASEAKSNFLANMSHEIRTPMNAILGMDEIIIREEKDNETVLKYAYDIQSAGNMLLSIINDILDLSKIESGKAELVVTDFETSGVLNDISNITKSRATDKGLSYHIKADSNVPKGLTGDEIRIRQIMLNVINNAIKYTDEGWVGVDVKYDKESEILTVAVTDTGIGIKEEDKAELFESFSRLEVTRNRNIEGTGLGLTITLNYLNLMGGRIDVESVYGEGSTFTITIPLKEWDATPMGDFSETVMTLDMNKNYMPNVIAEGARLLIVDDNEMNLDVINGLLKPTKVYVDNAMSGEAALELAGRKRYDLIMLDQMMPGMDGVTTMNKLRDAGVSTPIVVLTADADAKRAYLEKGFDGFVAKPVKGKDLEEALEEYLPDEMVKRPSEGPFGAGKNEMSDDVDGKEKPEKQLKKALVIDKDPKNLKQMMQDLDGIYDGVYVRDYEKARKYLENHNVDYIIFKDLKVVENEKKV